MTRSTTNDLAAMPSACYEEASQPCDGGALLPHVFGYAGLAYIVSPILSSSPWTAALPIRVRQCSSSRSGRLEARAASNDSDVSLDPPIIRTAFSQYGWNAGCPSVPRVISA